MYSEGIVIGIVVAIEPSGDGKRPDVLLVEDRSRPDYPTKVACEFFHKQKPLLERVKNGDLVRVLGGIKTQEGRQGGYFTHFVGFSVQPLNEYNAAKDNEIRKQHIERRGVDNEPLPF